MAETIQIRRDTAANWTAVDPVLAQGEFGVELDTNSFKIGDGASVWSALAYFASGGGGSPGPAGKDGQIRFTGHGAPGVIVGASPNDTYMDLDTGDIYKLS